MPRPMKDSGVEWLGEIPAHWKIGRVSYFFDIQLGKMLQPEPNDKTDTLENYLCAANLGGNKLKLDTLRQMWFSISDKTKFDVRKGDLLVVEGGDVASCDVITEDIHNVYIQNALHRVRSNSGFDVRLLRYLLIIAKAQGYIDLICNKATIAHFTKEKFAYIPFPVIPLDEQQRIATFLDGECARIDSVIEKTRASIVEYKKLKQAIITRAVTKGIRPARTMKDSGVEWLGDIPADWEIIPIKYLCSYNDEVLQENTDADFTFDYIEIGSVEFGKGIIEMQRVRFADAPSRARRIVQENDIIVSTVRTYLKAVAQIPYSETPLIASTGFVVIRPKNVNHIFLKYAILSNVIISMIESNSVGISYPAINAFQVVRFKIPVPPMEEQKEIAQYLDEKTAAIDLLVEKRNQLVTELERLKKSLIFEYVTGKKAVAQ